MKKITCVIVVLVIMLMLTACKKATQTSSQFSSEMAEKSDFAQSENIETEKEKKEDTDIDSHSVYGQDPFAVIPGKYTAVEQRATAVVTSPAIDTLQIVITGSGGAAYFAQWELTGKLDDSLNLNFKDSVLKLLTYNENGEIIKEETEYTDGSGRVVFDKDSVKFTWNDVKSGEGAVTFVLNQENE